MNIKQINNDNIVFGKYNKNHNHKKVNIKSYNSNPAIKNIYGKTNDKIQKPAMKQLSIFQRIGSVITAIILAGTTTASIATASVATNNKKANFEEKPVIEFQDTIDIRKNIFPPSIIIPEQEEEQQYIKEKLPEPLEPVCMDFEEEPQELTEEEIIAEKTNQLNKLLEENPELNDAYEDITKAMAVFSEQMGEDGYKLINRYIEEYGEGKVDKRDVYKMLYIESRGKVYDDDGNILESGCHAYGPFQVTKITEEGTNEKFNTNFDAKKPYDNLALHVLILRSLYDRRTKQIAEGQTLPTGDNIKHGIIWGYHDGAYASNISKYCKSYIETFDRLSILDEYPELYNLMEGNLSI